MAGLAVFDFDGTLSRSDSLWPFLLRAAGLARLAQATLAAAWAYLATPKDRDRRTYVKEKLLRVALGGLSLERAREGGAKMRRWPRWIKGSLDALRSHHEQGCHILIATGALDLYIEDMLTGVPHDGVVCTVMERKGAFLTGYMLSGNCVRKRKAQMVGEYIAAHGPFEEIWAYGNAPHDLPMMEWAQHKTIIP